MEPEVTRYKKLTWIGEVTYLHLKEIHKSIPLSVTVNFVSKSEKQKSFVCLDRGEWDCHFPGPLYVQEGKTKQASQFTPPLTLNEQWSLLLRRWGPFGYNPMIYTMAEEIYARMNGWLNEIWYNSKTD